METKNFPIIEAETLSIKDFKFCTKQIEIARCDEKKLLVCIAPTEHRLVFHIARTGTHIVEVADTLEEAIKIYNNASQM